MIGGLHSVGDVVQRVEADTVAVMACREMMGTRLRNLAWALKKTGTDICVAPALLDVAGPRTTIRPIAGLPLLHVDHPEFTGIKCLVKSAFDRVFAGAAVVLLLPVLAAIAVVIRMEGPGPVLFRQIRVGKDGQPFTLFKFRTMVVNAEQRRAELVVLMRATACCSRCVRTRALPARAAGSDATRWTNCRSSSTSLPETCPWSGRVPRYPTK